MVAVVAPMDPLVVTPKWAITPEPSSAMALAFSKVRAYHGVALRVKGKRNRAVSVRCSVVLSEKCPGDFKTEWDESLNKHGKIELNDIRNLSSESSIIFELERMALG